MTLSEFFNELCAKYGQKKVAAWAEIDISKVSRAKNGELGLTNQQWDRLLEKAGAEVFFRAYILRLEDSCLFAWEWVRREREKNLGGLTLDIGGD